MLNAVKSPTREDESMLNVEGRRVEEKSRLRKVEEESMLNVRVRRVEEESMLNVGGKRVEQESMM